MNIAKSLAHLFQAKEALGKRILNVAHLLTGNLFTSLVSLLTFALTARALGPNDYGMVAPQSLSTGQTDRIAEGY